MGDVLKVIVVAIIFWISYNMGIRHGKDELLRDQAEQHRMAMADSTNRTIQQLDKMIKTVDSLNLLLNTKILSKHKSKAAKDSAKFIMKPKEF
jgi:hypothetical protein